jgi:hypothetical protein
VDWGERFTITNLFGNYHFDNVGPGEHTVTEVMWPGWTQTLAPEAFTTTSGVNVHGLDFGNFKNVWIFGQKFNDMDGDGTKDPGEHGLAGWTIVLDGTRTAVTDQNGYYFFANVGPGSHTLTEVLQTGWMQTVAPEPFTVTSGHPVCDKDFGNFKLVTLSGMKFNDLDHDGTKDRGEPGLEGWTIVLDENGNGELDPGERFALTDSGGYYSFTDVGPGTHTLTEFLRSGWTQSVGPGPITVYSGMDVGDLDFGNYVPKPPPPPPPPPPGPPEGNVSNEVRFLMQMTPGSYNIPLLPERTEFGPGFVFEDYYGFLGRHFDMPRSGTEVLGMISGEVFHDDNMSGITDPGELGIGGQLIVLEREVRPGVYERVARTYTDGKGWYTFNDLRPSRYRVRAMLSPDLIQTNDADTEGVYNVWMQGPSRVTNRDFGTLSRSVGYLPPAHRTPHLVFNSTMHVPFGTNGIGATNTTDESVRDEFFKEWSEEGCPVTWETNLNLTPSEMRISPKVRDAFFGALASGALAITAWSRLHTEPSVPEESDRADRSEPRPDRNGLRT